MARLISSSRALYILEGIDVLAERIRHASEELRTLRDVGAVASPALDRPRGSGSRNSDAMANRLAAIERYESELVRNIGRWIEKQKEADKLISSLDNPKQMQALHMRYVEGCSVSLIADTMHYSKKQVYEITHKALDALDSILETRAQVERDESGKGGRIDSGESVIWPLSDYPGTGAENETNRKAERNAKRNGGIHIMSKGKASKERVDAYFNRFDAGEGSEQQPQDDDGERISITAKELRGIVSKAVKDASKAEDDRKRGLENESLAAKIAREHCERMNG